MNNMNDETTDATPKEVKHGGVFLEALNACDYQRRNGNTWTAEITNDEFNHSFVCELSFGFRCELWFGTEYESARFPTLNDDSIWMIIHNPHEGLFVPLNSMNESAFVTERTYGHASGNIEAIKLKPIYTMMESFPDLNQMVIDYFAPLMNEAQDEAIEILRAMAEANDGLVQRYLYDLVNPSEFMPCGSCGNVVSDIMYNWENDECVLCCSVSEVNE